MCTEAILKICVFVFAAITLILSYQFWHYLSFEFGTGREADAGVVIIYIISFIVTVFMCVLAIWAALRAKVKLALLVGITFLIMAVLLLIQIILFAVAASGTSCDILENIVPCGVDPGGLYAPLVLIMLSALALGVSLLLLWSVIKEDADEAGEQGKAKEKRQNYY
jgi:hypothetical protein